MLNDLVLTRTLTKKNLDTRTPKMNAFDATLLYRYGSNIVLPIHR